MSIFLFVGVEEGGAGMGCSPVSQAWIFHSAGIYLVCTLLVPIAASLSNAYERPMASLQGDSKLLRLGFDLVGDNMETAKQKPVRMRLPSPFTLPSEFDI